MAKQVYTQSSASDRIKRTDAYAESVRKQFNATVNEILALKKSLPVLEDGVMYSFDGDTVAIRNKVASLLKRLHASTTMTIQKGIEAEWETANKECDDFIKQVFSQHLLESSMFRAWTDHNTNAMNAFVNRSDSGMNLSDRVWQSCRQLRDEMEIAMTVGIGEGQSASSMSRIVRKCLNDPDLMFRRFRYKKGEDSQGNPIWGRKWKKKEIDPTTGKVHFVDYDKDSYIPKGAGANSRGVYKSAYKNAMRVTRTETNMAYRRADYVRWNQLSFVRGIHIELSNQHPDFDICDAMQGDYPKGFYFSGWHPHCFCYAVPILVDESEMKKVNDEFLKGRHYNPKGEMIRDTPPNFKQWIEDNSKRLRQARTKPYWAKWNPGYVDAVKGEALTPKLDPWEEARKRREAEKLAHKDERDAQARALREQRNKQFALDAKEAQAAMDDAQEYLMDVDVSRLQDLTIREQYTRMAEEAKKIQQQIADQKELEKKFEGIIPDVHKWHQTYSISEIENAYMNVKGRIGFMSGQPWTEQKRYLEIGISRENNEMIKAGLQKRLEYVKVEVKIEELTPKISAYTSTVGGSSLDAYKDLANKAESLLKARDIAGTEEALKMLDEMKDVAVRYDSLMSYYKTTRAGMGLAKTDSKVGVALKDAEALLKDGKVKEATKRIEDGEKTKAINEASNAAKAAKRKQAKEEQKTEPEEKEMTLADAKSYDDLKKIPGFVMPKTLEEYEEALKKYPCLSKELEKHKDEIEKALRKMFEDNDWGVAAHERHIESILDKGVLNQFQTGTSGGANFSSGKTTGKIDSSNGRLALSHRMFVPSTHGKVSGMRSGYTGKQFERGEYEKYGHLLSHDMKVSATKQHVQYGEVQIRMRKDKVVPTWTYGDTLDNASYWGGKYLQPTLAIDPKIHSFDEYVQSLDPKLMSDVVKFERKIDFDGLKYVEMQYHGELKADCFESLLFENGKNAITESIKKKCQQHGIKLYYYDRAQDKVIQIMLETPEEMQKRIKARNNARKAKRDAELAKKGYTPQEYTQKLLADRGAAMVKARDEVCDFLKNQSHMDNKDFPFSKIQDKLDKGNILGAKAESDRIKAEYAKMKQREDAVKDLIPDVEKWHKDFTMDELESAHSYIEKKFKYYETEAKFQSNDKKLLDQIEFDIKYVENPSKFRAGKTQEPTWKIVQSAYIRKRDEVVEKIYAAPVKEAFANIKAYKTSSPKIKGLIAEAEELIKQKKWDEAQAKIDEAEKVKAVNEASKIAKQKKKQSTTGVVFGAEDFTEERKAAAQWFKDPDVQKAFNAADAAMTKEAGKLWNQLSDEEKHVLWLYTSGSCYVNEPFYKRYANIKISKYDGSRRSSEKDINTLTSILEKSVTKKDMWVQHSEDTDAFLARFGVNLRDADLSKLVGVEGVQNPFLSTSCAKYSYFTKKELVGHKADVVMSIYVPKGAKGMYTEPFAYWGDGKSVYGDETTRYKEKGLKWDGTSRQEQGHAAGSQVEFLLQRGSKLRITKAEYKDGQWFVECELTEQKELETFKCGY